MYPQNRIIHLITVVLFLFIPVVISTANQDPPQEIILAEGTAINVVTAQEVTSKEALLRALERGLFFPDYFGHNWDALFDCLTDLSFAPSRGCCILLEDLGPFAQAAPQHLETLLEILCDAAQHWAKQSASFYVLVTALPGHGFHLDEVAL